MRITTIERRKIELVIERHVAAEIHHHDVVHFALEELQQGMTDSQRREVLHRLKEHLEQIKNRRVPAFR